jgi:glycosyltransferase involved in cell wall biosynthesis
MSPQDETCGYIRDFARSLSAEFSVTVLAPRDKRSVAWPADRFALKRSRSFLPNRFDPLLADADLNHLATGSLLEKLASLISLFCFFARALALASRADAICSHWMIPSGMVGALAGRILGKPHVVVEHSGALHLLIRMRGGKRLARFIVERSVRTVTVSADLARKLLALCPEAVKRVEVIPMGVSVDSANVGSQSPGLLSDPSNNRITKLLFIGRLTEIKGLDVLLKAIGGVEGLHLTVAGDGERRAELEALAEAMSVDGRFIGRISAAERQKLLSACDIVVIPSRVLGDGRTEGRPVVCLEAMAAGRVVIASRVGGLAETIDDGENGVLFDQNDHCMLKEKLLHILSDDRLRRKIALNARRSAAAYDWTRIGAQYSAIIKSALRTDDATCNRRIEADSTYG